MSTEDEQHIKILPIFHFVVGGVSAVFSLIPLMYLAIGLFIVSENMSANSGGGAPADLIGQVIVFIAIVFILLGLSMSFCMILVGHKLKKREGYTFCRIVAAIECLSLPFGTILGVLTLAVLNRESVKALFTDTPQRF